MHPVLLKIGSLSVYTYGFFIAVGFLVGFTVAKKEGERLGEDPNKIMDLCFYLLLAAIVTSRLFYVATTPEVFLADPLEIFRIWKGGLVFYGAFIGAMVTIVIYLRKEKMPLGKTLDILAPSLAVGHFFGRLGCLSAGCCYGRPCDIPWAITFSHPESLAPIGMPLHPTQIYSALNNLTIFALLWFLRRRKKFDGQLFWIYVAVYGVTRSVIELFRGDFRGGTVFGVLSISQTIGITFAIIAVIMLVVFARKAAKRQG